MMADKGMKSDRTNRPVRLLSFGVVTDGSIERDGQFVGPEWFDLITIGVVADLVEYRGRRAPDVEDDPDEGPPLEMVSRCTFRSIEDALGVLIERAGTPVTVWIDWGANTDPYELCEMAGTESDLVGLFAEDRAAIGHAEQHLVDPEVLAFVDPDDDEG